MIRIVSHAIQKLWIDCCGLLANQSCQRSSVRAVSLARGTETSVQMNFECCRLTEFVGWKLRASLIEIVGNAHRTDCVRTRWARTHLIELVERRHHGTFLLFHYIQIRRNLRSTGR